MNLHGEISSLSTIDGLKDLVICSIYQDTDGYIWLGSTSTLERYDGVNIKDFYISGDIELGKRVNSIAQTDDGRLWIATESGLLFLDKKTQKIKRIGEKIINKQIHSLIPLSDDKLLIGGNQGLFEYADGEISHILIDSNPISGANAIKDIDLDTENKCIWVATEKGVYRMDLSTHTPDYNPAQYLI